MRFQLAQPLFIYELGKRGNQEDSIYPNAGTATADDRLFIVCDGMGGHQHGEVASQTVCEALASYVKSHVDSETIFTDEMFEEALDEAYKQLDDKDQEADSLKKMGTTLTFILFHKGGCFMAHMGDSRIYHVRPQTKQLMYMSRDHSLVFDLFRSGEITFEEMKTHPKKNIITRAMMPGELNRINAEICNTTDILPGDYFYLCSDGMLEQMEEADISGILCSDNSDEVKKQRFISATLDNSDNHSAYLIRVTEVEHDGDESSYRNDELSSRSNAINYIPELNSKEVTKVAVGDFKSDDPIDEKPKKLFPWLKIMVTLILLSIIGLFILPVHLKKRESARYQKDEKGHVYNVSLLDEEDDIIDIDAKKDTTKKQLPVNKNLPTTKKTENKPAQQKPKDNSENKPISDPVVKTSEENVGGQSQEGGTPATTPATGEGGGGTTQPAGNSGGEQHTAQPTTPATTPATTTPPPPATPTTQGGE